MSSVTHQWQRWFITAEHVEVGVAVGGVEIPLYESKSYIWESIAYFWAAVIILLIVTLYYYTNDLTVKTMPIGLRSCNYGVAIVINWVVISLHTFPMRKCDPVKN